MSESVKLSGRGGSRKNSAHKACQGKGCEACNQTGKAIEAANKKRTHKPEDPAPAPPKDRATYILDNLKLSDEEWKQRGHADYKPTPTGEKRECHCEDCLWRRDAIQEKEKGRIARIHLWDRRSGKVVQPVDHNPNDKPVEINVRIHRVGGAKS